MDPLANLHFPLILVNFKSYSEALGKQGLKLARIAREVSEETGVTIAVAPQYVDIKTIVEEAQIPVFAQHVDPVEPGAFTGHVPVESVKAVGAVGALVNHSEKRLHLSDISAIVHRIRMQDLISVVCANTSTVASAASALGPDMIAIEPPELIGTGVAVSKAKPEVITEATAKIRKVNPEIAILCGAGITSGEDVSAAIELGTSGVLVASGVVKAKDQKVALMDLAKGSLKV